MVMILCNVNLLSISNVNLILSDATLTMQRQSDDQHPDAPEPHHSIPVNVNVRVKVPDGRQLTVDDIAESLEEVRLRLNLNLRFHMF